MVAMATTLLGLSSSAAPCFSSHATQREGIVRRRDLTFTVSSCKTFGSKQALQNVRPSSRVAPQIQRQSIVRCQAAEEEPTVDNSSVLVVGGGGIGLETFKALSSAGSWVTVYQRSEKFRKDIESLGAMLAIGDVLDPVAIEKTFKSNTFDAVVVTVGGGTANVEVDKDGPINFIDAAKKAGVKRFIMVSSIGAGDSKDAVDAKTYGVLEKVLIAKEAAEEYLRASGLEYTIIRPGGLLSGTPPSGKGILTEDPTVAGQISRSDVATLIFKILFDKRTISKTYSAIDSEKVFPGRPTDLREAHKPDLDNLSGVVTDAAIPEGHKGLHGFLYGEGDADVHDSALKVFSGKEGEDDGTSILGFEEYVSARESGKFSGVYAVYNSNAELEYVGYSRNVVLSLKSHRSRVGEERSASVRVKLYSKASIVSRGKLEEERQQWLEKEERVPPGNSHERDSWERSNGTVALHLMSEQERSEYEEKKLKMRKAMGENLYDDVQGEEESSRERRLKLLAAMEGDDWSSVIDGQTQLTVQEKVVEAVAETNTIQSPFVQSNVPIVSPFDQSSGSGSRLYSADVYELNVENVDLVLNEVRPYLISDGGNVEVASVDEGVVSLRLQGACGTCPSSTVTMKMGIERVLNEKFGSALKGVVQVDQQQIGATIMGVNAHLEMLRPAIHNYGGFVDVVSVDSVSGIAVVKFKGPAPIGMGIQAAIKDKFPDVKEVVLVDENRLVQV